MPLSLSICHYYLFIFFKFDDKTQPTCIVLIIDPKSHTHPYIYINNILCVYLTNQIFEESLNLLFFNH